MVELLGLNPGIDIPDLLLDHSHFIVRHLKTSALELATLFSPDLAYTRRSITEKKQPSII